MSADPSNAAGAIATAASTTRSVAAASRRVFALASTSARATWNSTVRLRSKSITSHTLSAVSHGSWFTYSAKNHDVVTALSGAPEVSNASCTRGNFSRTNVARTLWSAADASMSSS